MSRRSALVCLVAAIGIAGAPERDAHAGDEQAARAAVDRLDQRWQGASCRIRIPVEIKKKADRDGWSRSPWICPGGGAKEDNWCMVVWVSDRQDLASLMDGRSLRPGTRFVAEGFSFKDPDDARGLQLDLRFADAPARMRCTSSKAGSMSSGSFMSDRGVVSAELYMRLQAFEVLAPDERLEMVTQTAPGAPEVGFPQGPAGPSQEALLPAIRMTVVAAQPAQVRPGGEVRLVLHYEVSGVAADSPLEVTETRRLVAGGQVLATFDERVARSSGAFTSELPVQVPADLGPGLHGVEAAVTAAGVSGAGSALFEVVPGD